MTLERASFGVKMIIFLFFFCVYVYIPIYTTSRLVCYMFVCFKNGLLESDALDTYVFCVCVCCFSILFSLFFSDGVSEGSKRKKKKNFFTSVYLGKCIRKYIYIL